ncbi:MAG: acetyl-CoA carboxylase biotin carboxylase subunit [Myxococcota bacterium]|jgi:acetyl-CoA carboxylase biotin carboxylase subunit
MGIESVAVVSTADRDAQWLADADHVVCIGGPRASESYLNQAAILEAARHTGASAIHPGWGFLSENHRFAVRCAAAGITFVGPDPHHLRQMGDKALARDTMTALGLDPIPGVDGFLPNLETAKREADRIGYPVLLKAVSGGGGRGMRAVDEPSQLADAWRDAVAEATSAFGDGRMYLEKRIVGGRHVEIQVVGDRWGQAVHAYERECSIQRRHQKVIEEAPSPGLSSAERARVLPKVAEAVRKSGYVGAGTVEMLLDADGHMWFMEMNTRLQVEHGVTEELLGIDLVEWQLRVAANERLPVAQDALVPSGHVIELRLNAEDPADNFRPCPGTVSTLNWPQGDGIRVDTHLRAGDSIPPYYDSMVAKLVISGPDRPATIARAREALATSTIGGVTTNIPLLQQILDWDAFVSGNYDTKSLERDLLGAK